MKEVMNDAKDMWRETVRKLYENIKSVAEVGRGEGVEAGRRALVEGLRRLFEERERETLNAGRNEEALAIAVTSRLMLGIVNSQWEWFSLLAGDGVVDLHNQEIGLLSQVRRGGRCSPTSLGRMGWGVGSENKGIRGARGRVCQR